MHQTTRPPPGFLVSSWLSNLEREGGLSKLLSPSFTRYWKPLSKYPDHCSPNLYLNLPVTGSSVSHDLNAADPFIFVVI